MSNAAHLLHPRLRAAAEAIVGVLAARRGAPGVTARLDDVPEELFAEIVESARAAIEAGDAVTYAEVPVPRPRGRLSEADAAALALDLGASTIAVLIRNRRDGRARAALWAVGVPGTVLGHHEAHALWDGIAGVLRGFPDESASRSAPALTEEPRP